MLKNKIINKEKIIGMYVQLTDISISRIAGLAGYDFVWVDTEHSYMTNETVLGHILSLKSTGTPVVVRLPKDDLTCTKRIIEMGVDGVIFPMVNSVEELNRVIGNTLYPPYGERGFGPMGAIDYGMSDVIDFIDKKHLDLCRFVQIEDKSILDNFEDYMDNKYVDGFIFGPNDLAGSINLLGRQFDDKVTDLMNCFVKKLREKNRYFGIASGSYADRAILHWEQFEPDMICAGADFEFIRDCAIKNRMNLEKIHKKI